MQSEGRTFFRSLYYTLNFAPRLTRWRYLVASRNGTLAPETLRIVTRDGEDAGFALDEAPVTLPDGRPAARLSARNARPLLARPQAELRLEGKPLAGRVRTRTLVERLPAPTAERILPAGQAPPWSDIYLFL